MRPGSAIHPKPGKPGQALSVFCRGNRVVGQSAIGNLQHLIMLRQPHLALPGRGGRYTTRRFHATPCHAVRELIAWWHLLPSFVGNVRTPICGCNCLCEDGQARASQCHAGKLRISSGLAAHLCLQAGCCPAVMSVARAARASRSLIR
jgi:hypothetical protein